MRLTLETDDGHLIYMRYEGMRHGPAWVIEQLNKGEKVDPNRYYFRTTRGSRRRRRNTASSTASSASPPAGAIRPGRSTRCSISCEATIDGDDPARRGKAPM